MDHRENDLENSFSDSSDGEEQNMKINGAVEEESDEEDVEEDSVVIHNGNHSEESDSDEVKNGRESSEDENVSSLSEDESSSKLENHLKNITEENVVGNGFHEEDSDDENMRKSSRSVGRPRKSYYIAGDESSEEEDSPKTNNRGRPKKSLSTQSSPEDGSKKKRGRPRKCDTMESGEEHEYEPIKTGIKPKMNDEEIAKALGDSFNSSRRARKDVKYDFDDDDSDNDDQSDAEGSVDDEIQEDEDKEVESDEYESEDDDQQNKRRKVDEDDESIRRSGRERKIPKKYEIAVTKKKKRLKRIASDNSDNESDVSDVDSNQKKRKRKYKKKADKFDIYKKSPKKVKRKIKASKIKNLSGEEGSDASDSDSNFAKSYKKNLKKKRSEAGGKISAADYGDKKSGRHQERVKYAEEDESHSSDVASDYDDAGVVEEEIEGIDFVLDHRRGKVGATGETTMYWTVQENGDPNITLETEEIEDQLLIKWKGWSHLNNSWETKDTLDAKKKGEQEVKGLRKLINYQVKLDEFNAWKRRANPEDIEYQEIDIEMGRQLLQTYIEVERIISHRMNENEGQDYLVKWKNIPYGDATWEDESVIKSYYKNDLNTYNARRKSTSNPRSYSEAMKHVKKKYTSLKEQPSYLGGPGLNLRDYQLDGVNFMLNAWHKGNSTILADEMGLGKTIQSISFLKYLYHNYPFKGPMLVCVPLSTMAAWQKEFGLWAPDMNTVAYIGDGKSRELIRQYECENGEGELTFNVLLTNYEMVCKDKEFFQDISWSNIVVDEAHRLKNEESLLFKVLVGIESHHRLLLTGTPLQNSLKELWCLLKYLQLPEIDIDRWDEFEATYGTAEDRASGYVKLHSLLKPFIIRRMKKDVEKSLPPKVEQILRVEMTGRQKNIYKMVLTKNFDALSRGKNQVSLLNIMMQLRKACNHLELIQEPTEEEAARDPQERLHQLIYGSGKLLLLDKLLTRFREKGDRVLIFSQMVILLNILEEFLSLRRYPFQRLDGSVSNEKRKQSIAQFNDPNSKDFCFLLSTKAGGLGINLQTANRVVIFDSDWNPQNDLQAIARAHRIGQKEEVKIFRFVAKSSVDEDIIHRAKNKMVLDHLVIQSMDTTGKTVIGGKEGKKAGAGKTPFNKSELNMILKFGAEDLFKSDDIEDQDKEVDLDAILESAETREDEEAPQSEANQELLGAFKCTNIAFDEEEEIKAGEEAGVTRNWSEIIPSAMIEEHRPKVGLELYSDPEELFNPIAMRRKKRIKKRPAEDSAPTSAVASREGTPEEVSEAGGLESDSDMTDGEREMIKELNKRNREVGPGVSRGNYSKKSVICLECKKCFVDKKGLKKHMKEVHKIEGFIFSKANQLEAFPVNTDSPADSGAEAALMGSPEPEVKKRRGPPQSNTRCFPCNKCFQHRLGYKAHIKSKHDSVEPEANRDPANLALPDDRISCLICQKKFTTVLGLKGHIQRLHLGMNDEASNGNDEEEDEDNNSKNGGLKKNDPIAGDLKKETELRVTKTEESKPIVSQEDARLIERMYYMMRRYGCAFCSARFNNKAKLVMHEGIHAKDKKPVICPYCEKSYSRRDKLRKHIGSIHPGQLMPEPATPSPRVKKVANKSEEGNVPPAIRIEIETVNINGVTKFKCPICSTLFTYRKGCVRHVKDLHKNDRKFSCSLCSLTYSDSKGLYQHIKRKHPQGKTVDDGSDESEDIEDTDSSLAHKCKLCPKAYANAGSLWVHKRSRHPEIISKTNSPLVNSSPTTSTKVVGVPKKDYFCHVCNKSYSNYMSLYMHRKTKHPPGSPQTPQNTNSKVQVLVLGSPTLTSNGRREKTHQCGKCHKRYADLKGLAAHIEKAHQETTSSPAHSSEKALIDCPYCSNNYSRRDKLNEHIRKTHPNEEVPIMSRGMTPRQPSPTILVSQPGDNVIFDDDNSNSSRVSTVSSANSSGVTGGISVVSASPRKGNQGGHRGKYKDKAFNCTHCGKGYSDGGRLKTHIDTRHLQINDPWKDVGPNTVIAIRSPRVQSGFEFFKVLGVYSTGLRFKCARFAPLENDKWVLTEEINKNIYKMNIAMILTSLKKDDEGIYRLNSDELINLIKIVNDDKPLRGGNRSSSYAADVSSDCLNVSSVGVNVSPGGFEENNDGNSDDQSEEEETEEVVGEYDNVDEVVVQPVFEDEPEMEEDI